MVPKKIKPYIQISIQKEDGDNSLVGGLLKCCNDSDFEVFIYGDIKYSLFSKMYLYPKDDQLILKTRCKRCGNIVPVFDSSSDGYEQNQKSHHLYAPTRAIECKKCKGESFSVIIRYEYPNAQQLEELGITETDNAFTWIWITLKCNKCNTIYKNFIDFET